MTKTYEPEVKDTRDGRCGGRGDGPIQTGLIDGLPIKEQSQRGPNSKN